MSVTDNVKSVENKVVLEEITNKLPSFESQDESVTEKLEVSMEIEKGLMNGEDAIALQNSENISINMESEREAALIETNNRILLNLDQENEFQKSSNILIRDSNETNKNNGKVVRSSYAVNSNIDRIIVKFGEVVEVSFLMNFLP